MIIGLIAMYMPKPNEIGNISKYIGELDYCYLLDDSAQDNSSVVQTLLEEHPGKVQYYKNPYNMGLVGSVNNGFRMAIEKGAELDKNTNTLDGDVNSSVNTETKEFALNFTTAVQETEDAAKNVTADDSVENTEENKESKEEQDQKTENKSCKKSFS